MAISYFYEFTPKTAEYIDSLADKDRIGHHNYVIEQKYCNSSIAAVNMTQEQREHFDNECLDYLKFIDTEY